MADIFADQHVRTLLKDKVVLLLGDSNMRTIYKDLILLISRNQMQTIKMLKSRTGETFEGLDKRTRFKGWIKGRDYEEGREFSKFDVTIEYHFITRCYTPLIEDIMTKVRNGEKKTPDIVVMNSCLWDLSRWGPNGVDAFKQNMHKLMQLLKASLPEKTLFIWTTALPVSKEIKGGLLLKQLDFMQSLLRFEVMEANLFCRDLVVKHGYDILDLHYYLRNQIHRREEDGIHYLAGPIRFLTNLILTHISLSLNVALPGNFSGVALERMKTNCILQVACKPVQLPVVPAVLRETKDGVKQPEVTPTKKRSKYVKRNTVGRGGPRQMNSIRGPQQWWKNNQWQNSHPATAWTNDSSSNDQRVWSRSSDAQGGWENDEVWWNERPKPPHHQRYPPSIHMQHSCWNEDEQQKIGHSVYANFEQVGGPVRRNSKFPASRQRPY